MSHATTSTDLARDDDKSAEAGIETTPDRRGFIRTTIIGQKQALAGVIIVVIFVLIAIFAPLLAPYSIHEKTGAIYEAPSSAHWLGTDDGGVDMLSLMIYGSRVSLEVGFAAALVAMLIGGAITIEYVFDYPGIGLAIVDAIDKRDYAFLQGAFLVLTLSVIFCNFVADLLYFKLDPRVTT